MLLALCNIFSKIHVNKSLLHIYVILIEFYIISVYVCYRNCIELNEIAEQFEFDSNSVLFDSYLWMFEANIRIS